MESDPRFAGPGTVRPGKREVLETWKVSQLNLLRQKSVNIQPSSRLGQKSVNIQTPPEKS